MGDPLPYENNNAPDAEAPRPAIDRADWLVGADEGLGTAPESGEPGGATPNDPPRLIRPHDPDAVLPGAAGNPPVPLRGERPGSPAPSGSAAVSPVMPTWDRGHRSVPMVPRSAAPDGGRMSAAIPELARDFPMDDAEERARAGARTAEQQAREAAIAARPHEVVQPDEFDLADVPLPWWNQVPHLLRHDRRVQAMTLLPTLVLLAIALWPRAEKTIAVAHLKEHAERYADTQVRVGGSVDEVFPVGGSWAYTLIQGRDTIVVFTRTHRPKPREHVVVVGTLSSGYLDGQSRVAIFEATR